MTFRKRIYLIIILPIVLLAVVLVLYGWGTATFERKERNHHLTQQLSQEILNLNFVADRYFIYRHSGIYDYWLERHDVLDRFLSGLKPDNRREEVLLSEIRSNSRKIGNLFGELLKTRPATDQKLEERLLEAILLKSRMMYSDSARLERGSARNLEELRHAIVIYSIITGILITMTITATAVHLTKKVIKNIELLRQGTEKIAGGDLDVLVEVHTADELGALAKSFNEMAQRLKKSLIYMENSMKALEIENKMTRKAEEGAKRETQDRIRAEESLKELNAQLEERVRERTEEVKKASALLEKMKDHADREAYQARVAAERHREHHVKLQRLIAETGKIFSADTVNESLQLIAAIAREITGSRYCVIGHEFTETGFDIRAAAHRPQDPACLPDGVYARKDGVYHDLIEHGEAIVLTDAELRAHPRWWGLPEGHCQLRGLAAVPIIGEDNATTGMLMATDKLSGGDFTEDDITVLTQLALIASMAMQCISVKCGSRL